VADRDLGDKGRVRTMFLIWVLIQFTLYFGVHGVFILDALVDMSKIQQLGYFRALVKLNVLDDVRVSSVCSSAK
jgi:hypothetical protein